MNSAVFRWGGLLLLILLLANVAFIIRGHAPGSFVVPECWPSGEDDAIVNYASYFSGRMFWECFPAWKFEEWFGNNFFLNVLTKPFDPQNIIGAFLVDSFGWNLFEVFGWLRFLMFFASVVGMFLFMQYSRGLSERQAFLGALIFLSLPTAFFHAKYQNYWNIIVCVPYCLISIDAFIAKSTRLRGFFVAVLLSAPLLSGIINLYVDYVLLICAYFIFRIFERVELKLRGKMFREVLIIILLAFGMNSVGWVPTLIEMTSNSGQQYNVEGCQSAFNPIEFPFQILERLFPGRVTQSLDRLVATSFPPTSDGAWLRLQGLWLIILLLGMWRHFVARRKSFEIWWIFGLFGIGIVELVAEKLHLSAFMRISSMLRFDVNQERLGLIFFASLMVEGLVGMLAISRELSQNRRIMTVIGLAVLIWCQIRYGLVSGVLKNPHLSEIKAMTGHIREHGLWALFPETRWNMMIKSPFAAFALIFSALSTAFFGWLILFPKSRDIWRFAAVGFFICSIPFTATGYVGGYLPVPVRNEVFSSEFYRIQENELIVRSLLEQEGLAFRAVYFDWVETLRRRFSDRLWNDPFETLPGAKIFGVWYPSSKISFRPMLTGIAVPDGGVLIFPSQRKMDFFACNPDLFKKVGADTRSFHAINPFDERVATDMNVKYILSPYELPGLQLLHQSATESWKYLYEIASPKPIYSLHTENGMSEKDLIRRCHLGEKAIEIDVSCVASATVHLNIALDNYWKGTIGGVGVAVEPCGSIGVDIHVPPGETRILLTHNYWPLLWSGFLTLGMWLLAGFRAVTYSGRAIE
ncbi:MAG: hypothetical protein HQM09_17790 [Candidatus Riflebacteria bacterium]|nr:hypothetical protein [Candidatus Riflebacteria bacterium]